MEFFLTLCPQHRLPLDGLNGSRYLVFSAFHSGLDCALQYASNMDEVRGSDCLTSYAGPEILASYLRWECISIRQVSDTGESVPIPNNGPAALRQDVTDGTVKLVPDPDQMWAVRPF